MLAPMDRDAPGEHVEPALAIGVVVRARARAGRHAELGHVDVGRAGGGLRELGPPRMPRGVSCSAPGLTIFTALLPPGPGDRSQATASAGRRRGRTPLGPLVVERRPPCELGRAVTAAALPARRDELVGRARPAGALRHEEVVHDADARRARRRPRPEDRREADRPPALVAGEQLHALARGVGDETRGSYGAGPRRSARPRRSRSSRASASSSSGRSCSPTISILAIGRDAIACARCIRAWDLGSTSLCVGRDQHASTGCGGRTGRDRTVRGRGRRRERRPGAPGRQSAQRVRRSARAAAGLQGGPARRDLLPHPTARRAMPGSSSSRWTARPPVDGFRRDPVGPGAPIVAYTFLTRTGVTGSGTAADPLTQIHELHHAEHRPRHHPDHDLRQRRRRSSGCAGTCSAMAGPVHFKALAAADFFFEGSDRGTGILHPGTAQFIGGTNADTGASGGFVEVPVDVAPGRPTRPWNMAHGPGQVWNKVEGAETRRRPLTTPSSASRSTTPAPSSGTSTRPARRWPRVRRRPSS